MLIAWILRRIARSARSGRVSRRLSRPRSSRTARRRPMRRGVDQVRIAGQIGAVGRRSMRRGAGLLAGNSAMCTSSDSLGDRRRRDRDGAAAGDRRAEIQRPAADAASISMMTVAGPPARRRLEAGIAGVPLARAVPL